ncbi:Hypothetical protein PHPALM_11138, partial [Phytophthora palmivora]
RSSSSASWTRTLATTSASVPCAASGITRPVTACCSRMTRVYMLAATSRRSTSVESSLS